MDLIKRNTPILVMGGITLLILVGIIVSSNKSEDVELQEVNVEDLLADHTPINGPLSASFTLVEFSDFQCPACAAFAPSVKQLISTYPDDLRVAYRHFPLPQHENARMAAEAAQAAHAQNAFWEYHDKLFENQENLSKDDLVRYAQEIGLDAERIKTSLDTEEYANVVQADVSSGQNFNVNSTPTFFLNGRKVNITSPNSLFQLVSIEIENAKVSTNENEEENPIPANNSPEALIEKAKEPFYISYTEEGFSPKAPEVLIGQKVIWTNNTDQTIELTDTLEVYPDFPKPAVIAPGDSFEYDLTLEGMFALRETASSNTGLVAVIKLEETE